jgi:photosystem II stability/assembly factor-like uncharacterized protein
MKNLKYCIILSCILLTSCKDGATTTVPSETEHGAAREGVSIELNTINSDTTSVRALMYKDSTYRYAGSKGRYGAYTAADNSLKKGVIFTDSLELEFRSIAVTDDFTYVLNAGTPAYIYKINHSNEEVLKVYVEQGKDVFYDSLKFWNNDEGIAMGDSNAQGDKKCISILKTYDGGDTWKKISCENVPTYIEGEAGFAASNSNIAIIENNVWIATGGKAARVLYSADRGEHWVAYKTPIIAGSQMTGIFAMDFYDKNTGVIIGGNWEDKENNSSNKSITQDGGVTWTLLDPDNGAGYCSDVLFIPGTNGQELLAVGTPGVWWSGDQGGSWKLLSDQGFYTAAMKDQHSGMLMGYGKVARFKLK